MAAAAHANPFDTNPWTDHECTSRFLGLSELLKSSIDTLQSSGCINHLLVTDSAFTLARALRTLWRACSREAFEWSARSLAAASLQFVTQLYGPAGAPAGDWHVVVDEFSKEALRFINERSPQFVPVEKLARNAVSRWLSELASDGLLIAGADTFVEHSADAGAKLLLEKLQYLAGRVIQVSCKSLVKHQPMLLNAPEGERAYAPDGDSVLLRQEGVTVAANTPVWEVSCRMFAIDNLSLRNRAHALLVQHQPAWGNGAIAIFASDAPAGDVALPAQDHNPRTFPLEKYSVLVQTSYSPNARPQSLQTLALADPVCVAAEAAAAAQAAAAIQAVATAAAATAAAHAAAAIQAAATVAAQTAAAAAAAAAAAVVIPAIAAHPSSAALKSGRRSAKSDGPLLIQDEESAQTMQPSTSAAAAAAPALSSPAANAAAGTRTRFTYSSSSKKFQQLSSTPELQLSSTPMASQSSTSSSDSTVVAAPSATRIDRSLRPAQPASTPASAAAAALPDEASSGSRKRSAPSKEKCASGSKSSSAPAPKRAKQAEQMVLQPEQGVCELCKQEEDGCSSASDLWVNCEGKSHTPGAEVWYHYACVGIEKMSAKALKAYECPRCTGKPIEPLAGCNGRKVDWRNFATSKK